MISKGYKYKAKFIKFPQDRFTTFQISTKAKGSNNYTNFNMFCQGKIDIKDDDEIVIKEITGVNHSEYFSQKANKTFLNVTVYADIEVVGMGSAPVIETTIDGDDLPW